MRTLGRCFTLTILTACICAVLFVGHTLREIERTTQREHEMTMTLGEFNFKAHMRRVELKYQFDLQRLKLQGVDETLERLQR